MASVDDSHSLLYVSDWLPENQCGPCKTENKVKEAKYFCQVCNDYLCEKCKEQHKKFKDLASHKIVSASMISKSGADKGSGIPDVKCNCNRALVEFFCEEHYDVVCGPCKTIKHRKCTISTIQNKAAASKNLQKGFVLSRAKSLVSNMEHMESKKQAEKKNVGKLKDDCKAKIEAYQKQLISLLDGMKNDLLKDLGQMDDENITIIENQLSTLITTLPMLKADCKFLEEIQKGGNNEAIFAAGIKVANNLTDYETALLDMERETKAFSVSFEPNINLERMIRESKLGTLKTNNGQENNGRIKMNDQVVILDKKVVSSSKTEVQTDKDEDKSDIFGVSFLPNGKLLLADYYNNKVKLLSKSFVVEDSLELSSEPVDITSIDNNTGIVPLANEHKLQYIHMTPVLRKGHTISTDKACQCVKPLGDELFVAWGEWDKGEIVVLDVSGTVRRRIGVNRDGSSMFGYPGYLAVCSASRKIYVSDCGKDTIFCFTYDGKVVYQYRNDNLKTPYGLYVDDEDNVLVCDDNEDNFYVITAQGKKHATLLSSENGLVRPGCLDYRPSDRTLIVGSYEGSLYVFKLS